MLPCSWRASAATSPQPSGCWCPCERTTNLMGSLYQKSREVRANITYGLYVDVEMPAGLSTRSAEIRV